MQVPARDGRTLLLTLVAEGDEPPQVEIEVVLTPGGPALRVAMLDPADVVSAGSALRRLAVLSSARAPEQHKSPLPD